MDDIMKFLRDEGLSKKLLDALPCGLLLINRKGYVLAVNNIFENAFGCKPTINCRSDQRVHSSNYGTRNFAAGHGNRGAMQRGEP